jgi:HK97 gp10 family phage protein
MALIQPIGIEGLDQFVKNLKKVDRELPKAVRLAGNEAADLIVSWAKPKVPHKTGKAANSIKAASAQKAARVKAGGNKAPYYAWLDFGGKTGRKKATKRKFYTDGRYLYPALEAQRPQIREAYENALIKLVENSGIDVT